MRIVLAAAVLALLAGPAFAQNVDDHVPRYGEEEKEKTPEQKRGEKAAQDAYQRSLSNIPDKGSTDPSTFALIVAPQSSPVAQARSMTVMDCCLLALANSQTRFLVCTLIRQHSRKGSPALNSESLGSPVC